MIEFQNVSMAYKDRPVLNHVDLTIQDSEFFVLIGSSGCGKTTLLKSINKLLNVQKGKLLINGTPVDRIKTNQLPNLVGYVVIISMACASGNPEVSPVSFLMENPFLKNKIPVTAAKTSNIAAAVFFQFLMNSQTPVFCRVPSQVFVLLCFFANCFLRFLTAFSVFLFPVLPAFIPALE